MVCRVLLLFGNGWFYNNTLWLIHCHWISRFFPSAQRPWSNADEYGWTDHMNPMRIDTMTTKKKKKQVFAYIMGHIVCLLACSEYYLFCKSHTWIISVYRYHAFVNGYKCVILICQLIVVALVIFNRCKLYRAQRSHCRFCVHFFMFQFSVCTLYNPKVCSSCPLQVQI